MKEVNVLKKYCDKLKPYLQAGVSREANDFFAKTEDLYYDTIPEYIDTSPILAQEGLWEKDIDQAINSAKPNFLAIAAVIRGKYAEHFRAIEKEKDKDAKGERKGKELIRFTLPPKMVDEIYSHWRNLNKLVHPEINEEDDLTKATDKERRRVLSVALNCYVQKLSPSKKIGEKK